MTFSVNDLEAFAKTTKSGNVFVRIDSASGNARLVYNPASGHVAMHDTRMEQRLDPATKQTKSMPVTHRFSGFAPTRLSPRELVEHLELDEPGRLSYGGADIYTIPPDRGRGLMKVSQRIGDKTTNALGLKTRLQNAWKAFRAK
jgi:hypothetical protein